MVIFFSTLHIRMRYASKIYKFKSTRDDVYTPFYERPLTVIKSSWDVFPRLDRAVFFFFSFSYVVYFAISPDVNRNVYYTGVVN